MFNKQYDDYEKRVKEEIAHYKKVFKGRMCQEVPPVWNKVEEHFADNIQEITGVRNLYEYVARHVKTKTKVSVLGLGSGACGNELDGILPLLRQQGCEMELTCLDINEGILKQAQEEASKRNVKFEAMQADINKIKLPHEKYDVIVAYAALHHFIELGYIAKEIKKSLKDDGIFVTVDIPTRNGYRMWEETYNMVNSIWFSLPPKFKMDYTGYSEPTFVERYENIDYSRNSFECINSEAILPALRKNLKEVHFVPSLAFARRFFDTKFGPNYNLELQLDKSIFDYIIQLDYYYIKNDILKPETFFGAYAKV